MFYFQMRRRWREGSSLLTLLVLVAATTANDSSLFECPKGSYRFTPLTDLSFPSERLDWARLSRTIDQPSLLSPFNIILRSSPLYKIMR